MAPPAKQSLKGSSHPRWFYLFAALAVVGAIAAGFGMPACDLDAQSDPLSALASALAAPGPALIHATISPGEMVLPMVPPGAANRDMIGGMTHAASF